MRKRFFIGILLVFQVFFTTYAINFKTISLLDGLSQPSVLSICQDDLGRMWFATAEGINIYDGRQIKVLKGNIATPDGFLWIGNYIKKIDSDGKGNIFFLANNDLFQINIKEDKYKQLTVNEHVIDFDIHEGNVWFISGHKLMCYRVCDDLFEVKKQLPEAPYSLIKLGRDCIYLGGFDGLYKYSKTLTLQQKVMDLGISAIYESSAQELWIGTIDDGVFRLTRGGLQQISDWHTGSKSSQNMEVRQFLEDAYGNIWMGTKNWIRKFNHATQLCEMVKFPQYVDEIDAHSVYSLYIDKQQNLWIGTFHLGVEYFNLTYEGVVHYNYKSIEHKSVTSVCINDMVNDEENNLWLATEREGLCCLSADGVVKQQFNQTTHPSLPSNCIKTMEYDKVNHQLFIGMFQGGLSVYDLKSKQLKHYNLPHVLPPYKRKNTVLHLEWWRDNLYLSTSNDFYAFNSKKGTFTHIAPLYGSCIDFKISDKGTVIARLQNGIEIFPLANPSAKKRVNLFDYNYKGDVSSLLLSENGVYLLTLGNGILHYDVKQDSITAYTTANSSIPSDYCYQIKRINSTNLVFTCDKGVAFFNQQNKQFKLLKHSTKDVALVRDFALEVSADKEIFVGDLTGVMKLNETHFEVFKDTAYTLFFTDLYINNELYAPKQHGNYRTSKVIPYLKELSLTHQKNNIQLHFANTDYLNQRLSETYAYKLEGVDKKWSFTTTGSIQYSHLQPGTYLLQLKIANREDSPMAQLQIHIASPLYLRWWAVMCYIFGGLTLVVLIYRYKTKQDRLALSLKNERFEKEKNKQLNDEKLQFFTNVSHEFRTPLTLINGYLDAILAKPSIPTPIYNDTYQIKKNVQYMNNLVSELLDFRKISNHSYKLHVAEGDFIHFMQEIYCTFSQLAERKHLHFNFTTTCNEVWGWYDAKQLEKVFFNLISNSFKFTPEGGSVSLAVSANMQEVSVLVSDTGKGISTSALPSIFNQFFQDANQADYQHLPGSGIGLALTKSIVELHHGSIQVDTALGKGSIFKVVIPLQKQIYQADEYVDVVEDNSAVDYDVTQPLAVEETPNSPSLQGYEAAETDGSVLLDEPNEKKYKLLLVEDNADLLQMLKVIFEKQYEVVLATNGKEALDKVQENNPDLIISDVMMPVMSGTELCLRVKNNIDLCHIPIILLTALTGVEQNIEGFNRGADDYVTKPFNAQILLARVNNLIRNRLLIQMQLSKKKVAEINLTSINPIDKQLLAKTEKLLEVNLENTTFSVSDLCAELAMGRSQLYTKFKALTGMTPNDFILNYRIKQAASYLHTHSEMNITDISVMCGFSSVSYFGKCFKQQYGVSPTVYRNTSKTTLEGAD